MRERERQNMKLQHIYIWILSEVVYMYNNLGKAYPQAKFSSLHFQVVHF